MIERANKRNKNTIEIKDLREYIKVITPVYSNWDIPKLQLILQRLKVNKKIINKIIKAKVSYSVDEKPLDKLIKSKKIKIKDLKKVLVEKSGKTHIKVFELKDG